MDDRFEDPHSDNLEEVEYTVDDEGERFNCIIQRLLMSSKKKKPQRHVLFRTRCTINKMCDVIVDEVVKV